MKARIAHFERLDLASTSDLEGLATRTLERHGQIDVLGNVAAIYPAAPFLETTPDRWEKIVGINLRAVFFLSQAVIRCMIPRKSGVVVNALVKYTPSSAIRSMFGVST